MPAGSSALTVLTPLMELRCGSHLPVTPGDFVGLLARMMHHPSQVPTVPVCRHYTASHPGLSYTALTMPRFIEIELQKRGVSCTAQLLDERAPRTCEAVWQALPIEGNVFHAKYASNEIYTLVPPFADSEPGLENPTMLPTTGDVMYFFIPPGTVCIPEVRERADRTGLIDLAIFYDRDNFLFSPTLGPVPGSRFATITENMEAMTKAGDNIWREGFSGERLIFRQHE